MNLRKKRAQEIAKQINYCDKILNELKTNTDICYYIGPVNSANEWDIIESKLRASGFLWIDSGNDRVTLHQSSESKSFTVWSKHIGRTSDTFEENRAKDSGRFEYKELKQVDFKKFLSSI